MEHCQAVFEQALTGKAYGEVEAILVAKGGTPLSDKEFERILVHIKGKSVYESAMSLRDKYILPRDDGSEIYLKLFDPDNPLKNIFQFSSQVTMVGKYTNRYDVTILINSLPLVQIELKRRGLAVREAFNQIERYRKHS